MKVSYDSEGVANRYEGLGNGVIALARLCFFGPLLAVAVFVFLLSFLPSVARALPRELLSAVALSSLLGIYVAPFVALAGYLITKLRVPRRAAVSVNDGALELKRKSDVTRHAPGTFQGGWLDPKAQRLELETKRGNIVEIALPSVDDGRATLAALGLDAARRTVKLRLGFTDFLTAMTYLAGLPLTLWFCMSAGRALGLDAGVVLLLGFGVFMALRRAIFGWFGPAELTIGADGVRIGQRFTTHFLSFADIDDFIVDDHAVTFLLHDGTTVKARARHLLSDKAEGIRERLSQAKEAYLGGGASVHTRAQLSRLGRPLDAWRGSLSALLRRDDYRDAPVERDDLWAIATSPTEAAEHRIGAALSLLSQPERGEPLHERLRVAAASSASDKLRVALEHLAEGHADDALLEAALDEAEQQRAKTADRP